MKSVTMDSFDGCLGLSLEASVTKGKFIEDGNHLYRFLDDDPIVSQCHNIPKGIIDVKPKPIIDIASRLRFLSCAILDPMCQKMESILITEVSTEVRNLQGI
ncbi:hypothetical protein M0R45_036347 [Rubus argutus]|uniref:Uncharacterized protein n=1 Tax=Rubus argutus TaxID=59490 RepID=A0AAW1VXM2_RUBAR